MARAVQELWPDTKVTIGPVIENGWYYDFDRAEPFTPDDLGAIEARMRQIIAARDPVRWEVWDRDRAIAHYRATNEPFKVELVEAIPEGQPIRMYWHGDWQDLCRGPHLAHTGQVPADAFKLMSIAGAYWRGDAPADAPAHLRHRLPHPRGPRGPPPPPRGGRQARPPQARPRDGPLPLPGRGGRLGLLAPHGFTVWRILEAYIRRQLDADGYVEVKTPQLLDAELWRQSGHWGKFRENMFVVPDEIPSVEDEDTDPVLSADARLMALKPMNCPAHVQIFKQGTKSYRDLPLGWPSSAAATATRRTARCTA
jgi:threonyl-tRNA synthetase